MFALIALYFAAHYPDKLSKLVLVDAGAPLPWHTPEEQPAGTFSEYQLRQKPAHFEVIDTPGGVAYGARRPGPVGQHYWRIAQFALPFYTFTPPGVLGVKKNNGARVPMDDYHTMSFFMNVGGRRPNTGPSAAFPEKLPNTSDWYSAGPQGPTARRTVPPCRR